MNKIKQLINENFADEISEGHNEIVFGNGRSYICKRGFPVLFLGSFKNRLYIMLVCNDDLNTMKPLTPCIRFHGRQNLLYYQ